ncbi:hypothetical protein [Sphingobium sp. YBL2]|uniref:hypothetical protein n=1 Tax=Sphingobium sp. (strain YBL2) TaxID=484429 RepID=UPI0005CBC627|nr:hypothetical protein [Sphingobium sp. YBL2]AJR24555.1 hypothetical protein TZ53_13310 [Sphingobium sp. YBL2]
MKFVKLRTSAHVNGVLRHPDEGVLHVTNEEAERLFENESADDVTADFDEELAKAAPKDTITTGKNAAKPAAADNQE